jgi:hypothetical protein
MWPTLYVTLVPLYQLQPSIGILARDLASYIMARGPTQHIQYARREEITRRSYPWPLMTVMDHCSARTLLAKFAEGMVVNVAGTYGFTATENKLRGEGK